MDKNEFYNSRDEYLEHAGVRDAVNKVRGKVWNKKVREARSGDKNEKLGDDKYLDRNFARPYSSPNTTGKYDNPNAQAWVNKEGYYTENNTRAYSESVQNLVDQISAQLSKSENDKKRNSNAYFKAMKSVISREIGELADAILKIESSGSRKAYNKDLEDLRSRFNALSFGNEYIAHAAYIPKNPRKDHKYLYIDKNGRYVYEEPKKSSRPYSSPNNVNVGGRYTAEDQRRNATNMKIKEYNSTLKQARTIYDEARKLLELDGAQAAYDHLNNYNKSGFADRFSDLYDNRSIDKDIEKSFNEFDEFRKKVESDIRADLKKYGAESKNKAQKIKEYKDTLKQARTILDEARKLLELDGAQAAFDHLNNYINSEFEARFDDLSNNRSIDKDIEKSFNELLEINKKLESDIRAGLKKK